MDIKNTKTVCFFIIIRIDSLINNDYFMDCNEDNNKDHQLL